MSWRKVQYLLFSTDFLKKEGKLLFSRIFRRFSTVDKNWREIMKVAVLVSVASIYFIRLIRFCHNDTIIIIIHHRRRHRHRHHHLSSSSVIIIRHHRHRHRHRHRHHHPHHHHHHHHRHHHPSSSSSSSSSIIITIIIIIIIIVIVNNIIIVVKNRIAIILSKSSWSSFEPLVSFLLSFFPQHRNHKCACVTFRL